MNATGDASKLGPYQLDAKLGEGGMGIVYRATDGQLHREVAIKVLHPHLLQNDNLKERFRREARMHARLMHPNVVTLLSLYEDMGQMALVMEMVHGCNLKEYLRDHPNRPVSQTAKIALAVLEGLDAAHHMGMVHRDLKPANVLLSNEGGVKLMDFGLAKPERGDDDLTQSGATVGSFRYMAPEQILNQPIDARTDLYAFGILLYQMFTGKLPFDATAQGGGEFEIMEKQVREIPNSPQELNPAIPKELSELILKLLEKSQANRPANCAEVKAILSRYADDYLERTQYENTRIATPYRQHEHSNAEIAKGLLNAVGQKIRALLETLLARVSSGVGVLFDASEKAFERLTQRMGTLPVPEKWQQPLIWGGVALGVVVAGWLLFATGSDKQQSETVTAQTPVVEALQEEAKAPQTPAPEPAQKPEVKEPPKEPAAKPVPPKPKPVAKPAPKPAPKSVTFNVGHKVIRNDGGSVDSASLHEFRGGSVLFFESLKSYKWKETLHIFKNGQTRLILDQPVSLSAIVLNKASIGRLDFKGGDVELAVQTSDRKWHSVFTRKDDDVDIRVTITRPTSVLRDVIGVRLRFKTPEPITIGPIDLLP